jgi:hypothetical protein
MEATRSSEMSTVARATQRHIPLGPICFFSRLSTNIRPEVAECISAKFDVWGFTYPRQQDSLWFKIGQQ